MSRHLKRSHPDINFDPSSVPGNDDSFEWPSDPMEIHMDQDQLDADLLRGSTRSKVWNYFERQVKNFTILCVESDKIWSGLFKFKSDLVYKVLKISLNTCQLRVALKDLMIYMYLRNDNLIIVSVWKLKFLLQDKTRSLCLNCDVVIKTELGNTTGMSRHLKRYHPGIWNTFDDAGNFNDVLLGSNNDLYDDDVVKGRLRSVVWNYYTREDKTTAVCTLCNSAVKTGNVIFWP